MIGFILNGHALLNDVQTMIQVFYPNLHYKQTQLPEESGITIESIWREGTAQAVLYRDGQKQRAAEFAAKPPITQKEQKRAVKAAIFRLLEQERCMTPKWGLLTGVRPAKLVSMLLEEGYDDAACLRYLEEDYFVARQKAELALQVAKAETAILAKNQPEDIHLYIGIPFCPTRCLYCSFTAYPLGQYRNRVDEYLDALIKELRFLQRYTKGKRLRSLYIGGGTPTSLNETQLERLLSETAELFLTDGTAEYTVEAGRPDTITEKKLRLIKQYGADRISINPQTMNDRTLEVVGRRHTAADTQAVFFAAREAGHDNINMDLILGLPEEQPQDVAATLAAIKKLAPDNLTVHTLAVKRASRLKEQFDQYTMTTAKTLEEMLLLADRGAREMGMLPYYMYRQKNMVGNFENVGYAHPGKESIYNVEIMEEKQTILAAGAGGSTKTVDPETDRIERVFNVKSVEEYIGRIDEMIERKRVGLQALGGKV